MKLQVTVKVLDPKMLAKGGDEVTVFDTDGIFLVLNGINDTPEICGGAVMGELSSEMVAETIHRTPEMFKPVTASLISRMFVGKVIGPTVKGKSLAEIMERSGELSEIAAKIRAEQERQEADMNEYDEPTCPSDPLFSDKIVQIDGNKPE